jgi:hypothetical protein
MTVLAVCSGIIGSAKISSCHHTETGVRMRVSKPPVCTASSCSSWQNANPQTAKLLKFHDILELRKLLVVSRTHGTLERGKAGSTTGIPDINLKL